MEKEVTEQKITIDGSEYQLEAYQKMLKVNYRVSTVADSRTKAFKCTRPRLHKLHVMPMCTALQSRSA